MLLYPHLMAWSWLEIEIFHDLILHDQTRQHGAVQAGGGC